MNVFASRANIDIGGRRQIGCGRELPRRDSEGLPSVGNLGEYQIEGGAPFQRRVPVSKTCPRAWVFQNYPPINDDSFRF